MTRVAPQERLGLWEDGERGAESGRPKSSQARLATRAKQDYWDYYVGGNSPPTVCVSVVSNLLSLLFPPLRTKRFEFCF